MGPIRHRPRDPDGHFGALVRAIVFQQLAGRGRAGHPRPGAGPGRRAARRPRRSLAVPDDDLRGAGLSGAKLASLRDLSAKVLDGTVVPRRLRGRSDEEIVARLVTVRGIGRWTAEMYLMFELRRLDVWPVDDLGVRQGYGLAWGIDPPPIAEPARAPRRPLPALPVGRRPLLLGGAGARPRGDRPRAAVTGPQVRSSIRRSARDRAPAVTQRPNQARRRAARR